MVFLENDNFLSELTRMYRKSRINGSVTLTVKRYDGRTKPYSKRDVKPLQEPTEYLCLFRAVLRSSKISTVVHSKDINKFQQAHSNLLKGNLDGLKKLKKNKAKPKATQ